MKTDIRNYYQIKLYLQLYKIAYFLVILKYMKTLRQNVLFHEAHFKGMGVYKNFFTKTTDPQIKKVIDKLIQQGEFDNKIFIIVADHGMTQMPIFGEVILYPGTEDERSVVPDMSCALKTAGFNKREIQDSEKTNNNLHIWELGEMLKQMPTGELTTEGKKVYYKILAPVEIVDANKGETTTNDPKQASIIAALNGPMAHIYVKGANEWNENPQNELLMKVARLLKVSFAQGDGPIPQLSSSVETILIRDTLTSDYTVFYGDINNTAYVNAINRTKGMNNKDRSGDIILIMKDLISGNAIDRYTTGVACKSWHGSLNPSDSYVPFIVAYPGGNKIELDPIIKKVCPDNVCEGNWKAKDLITEIIKTQYSGQ